MPPVAPSLSLSSPVLRAGQTLDYRGLRDEVRAEVHRLLGQGKTRAEVAAMVPVSMGSLSDAMNKVGSRYAGMQQTVLKALRPVYDFEDVGGYRVVRKG